MGMKVEHHKALCPFHDDHHASLTFRFEVEHLRTFFESHPKALEMIFASNAAAVASQTDTTQA